MLELKDFEQARERIGNAIKPTPLIFSDVFSREYANQVYIKPENLQNTGSFKIRGAYNKILQLSQEERERGLIAASAGNHAQGVASAAQKLGVEAVIVMPKATPLTKVEATQDYGAQVVLWGDVYDESYQKALELQKEHGYSFIHPFNDEDVIAGQGTIALEILGDLPEADVILVPTGGGGLISGIAAAAKQVKPTIKIIGVEPEGAASAMAALHKGHVVELEDCYTIADGTAVKKIGDINFGYIQQYVDGVITVSDYELMDAFLLLVEKHKLVAENSGILPLASLRKLNERNKKVVALVSGGNIDVLTISSLINKGLVERGRIFSFSVQLPDKPGQLCKVSEILYQQSANVIKLDHNQFKNLDRFQEVELHVVAETNSEDHIRAIIEEFNRQGYRITRININ